MKHYNCQGCGQKLQSENMYEPGYTTKADATFCTKCFRSLHYGEKENDLTEFDITTYLDRLQEENNEVIMVIDVMNAYQTLMTDVNKYITPERLTVVVNKVDALPKAISAEAIIEYVAKIAEDKGIGFKNIALVSSTKLENVDALYNYIMTLDERVSIIGYSNVGKTSFIKALFKSKVEDINNLVSYTIGTTLEPIELKLEDKTIIDYPGFMLKGNIQNNLNKDDLRLLIPRKEVKVKTYQLEEQQIMNIGNYAQFIVETSYETQGYQFSFSNDVEVERHKLNEKWINTDLVEHKITPLEGIYRQDIIISGLGIVTFNNMGQELAVRAPKNVAVDVVESLYSKE